MNTQLLQKKCEDHISENAENLFSMGLENPQFKFISCSSYRISALTIMKLITFLITFLVVSKMQTFKQRC